MRHFQLQAFLWWSSIVCVTYAQLPSLDSCYNGTVPVYCEPGLVTFTRRRTPEVNSTCGTPAINFCSRTVSLGRVTSDCSAVCDAANESLSHPPSYLTDFVLEPTSWQSENSLTTQNIVSIDFSLGISVAIDVIDIDFESFLPTNFRILKSTDNGQTYTDFHYYAQSCLASYSVASGLQLTLANETSVLCDTFATHNPRRVSFAPLFGRPSFNDSVPGLSDALYNFISATDIRLLLVEHYPIPNLAPDDLGYYYAIQDISIIGSCQCNGHGYDCQKVSDAFSPAQYNCVCGHNTTGINCERCADFYQDVPWQSINGSNTFECRACNCNGFSDECRFDPSVYEESGRTSGGVCLNCRQNRAGKNCETCAEFFYPEGTAINFTCTACACNRAGSLVSGVCARDADGRVLPGDCSCKANTQGRLCDMCKPGFFNLTADNEQGCQPCGCVVNNSLAVACDNITGSCTCKPNTVGGNCNRCLDGFYLPDPTSEAGCVSCGCNLGGATSQICDMQSGQCTCKTGIGGSTCSEVLPNYFVRGIDYILQEAEEIATPGEIALEENPSPFFTGIGYFNVTEEASVIEFGSIVPPVGGQYRVIIRYTLTGALRYNSSILTVTPFSSNSNVGVPVDCGSGLDEITTPTSIQYTGWRMGVGRSVVMTLCLRGGQSYDFSMGSFIAGEGGSLAQLLVDSLVLAPWEVGSAIFSLDPQTVSLYQQCVAFYSNLATIPSAPSFCPQAIFDVSTDIYNGVAACGCDTVGTVPGTVCQSLGGQCSCLPYVRGRGCDACYPGNFGLSITGCRSCGCDLAGSVSDLCDPVSGNCTCLENVSGRDCSSCLPNHWDLLGPGGCISCNCDPIGSLSPQCDMFTGECRCAPGVTGNTCSQCQDFFYGFSAQGCTSCDCHPVGSSSPSCASTSGQCPCLSSTSGRDCSQCIDGTYNLSPANPEGCQSCFCNGRASSCVSAVGFLNSNISTYFRNNMLNGWAGFTSSSMPSDPLIGSGALSTAGSLFGGEGLDVDSNSSIYLEAPGKFLGNRLLSYSQYVRANLVPNTANPITFSYDVLLEGGRVTLGVGYNRTAEGYQVELRETAGWVNVDTGVGVTKQQFKFILSSLTRLLVSISFDSNVLLSSIEMGTAVSAAGNPGQLPGEEVSYVEQCTCPANYTGFSCESCAPGYTRSPSGCCELCRCNGLSTECHPETGECFNCSGFATGPLCNMCGRGSFGDPTRGLECRACPCPLDTAPGQFTNECELTTSGEVRCLNCPLGHTGSRCESCLNGYFGDPTGILTGTPTGCSDCTCSGNIDLSDPRSCDRVTGVCNCTGNTAGQQCDRCADGFYGDAILAKNCTACGCDPSGSRSPVCNTTSGVCQCLPNISGQQCGGCLPAYFGFGTSEGCQACNCNPLGAVGVGCASNGQCMCRPGVLGRTCDECLPGYFGFSGSGCSACSCSPRNSAPTMCDVVTGQCMCLTGATGSSCDQCVENYYMVNNICTSCPKCYQDLEGVYNSSLLSLLEAEATFQSVSSETADLAPFDDRIAQYQLNASSLLAVALALRQRQDDIMAVYGQLLFSVNVTLRGNVEAINDSALVVENQFTTSYILALSAQSLMEVTLNEFRMVTSVLNEVENVRIPSMMALVDQISGHSRDVNETARELQSQSANLTSDIAALETLISRVASESSLLRSEAAALSSLQEEVMDGIEQLRSVIREVRMDAGETRANLSSVQAQLAALERRVGSKFGSLPNIENTSRIRMLIRQANESRAYAQDELLAEIRRQRRNFSVINETYTSNLISFQQQLETISSLSSRVTDHLTVVQSAYMTAKNITEKGSRVIATAAMVAENLENFRNKTFLVQDQVNEALQGVNEANGRSMEALNRANATIAAVQEAQRTVSVAQDLALNASGIANASLQDVSSANTSSIMPSINSSLHSSLQALSQIQLSSSMLLYYYNMFPDLEARVGRGQASVERLRTDADRIREVRDVSSANLDLVREAFVDLQPVDETKLVGVRELLGATREALREANVYETYQHLRQKLDHQRSERERLENQLRSLMADVDHLRRINDALPVLPDRCN